MITKLLGPLLAALFISPAFSKELAITIDDFEVRSVKDDQNILRALKKHNLQAALFVRCKYLDTPWIKKRFLEWDQAGHLIANHTYSHESYNKSENGFYKSDILRCHEMIKSAKNFRYLFRFPYLKGGNTKEKRDEMQSFLKEHNYKNGYVSIDTSDWFISYRLSERLKKNPNTGLKAYRDYYIRHMLDRAECYDGLAKKYWKKPVKHTILMHHNLINSLFLDDLILAFKTKGWKFVSAEEAFKDPIYDSVPDVLPFGESIVWSFAKKSGDQTMRYPGEDERYEINAIKKAGL